MALATILTVVFVSMLVGQGYLFIHGGQLDTTQLIAAFALANGSGVVAALLSASYIAALLKQAYAFRPISMSAPAPVPTLPPSEPVTNPVLKLDPTPDPVKPPDPTATYKVEGRMSVFGGSGDNSDIGGDLAFWNEAQAQTRPDLFTSIGPRLFNRLNTNAYYLAMRWDYKQTPKSFLRSIKVKLTNPTTGKTVEATPVDWGPNERTGRVVDVSPGAAKALGLDTDQIVIAEVPLPQGIKPPDSAAPVAGTPWLSIANNLLGLQETPGSSDNSTILEMARRCGGDIAATYKHDEIPWCALFANYCVKTAGFPSTDTLWALDFSASKYADRFTKLPGPAVGAIATKKRDGGGHVFFVLGKTANGDIVGLGGNQSDMVCDSTFDPSVLTYVWPKSAALPASTGMSTLPVITPRQHVKRDVVLP